MGCKHPLLAKRPLFTTSNPAPRNVRLQIFVGAVWVGADGEVKKETKRKCLQKK